MNSEAEKYILYGGLIDITTMELYKAGEINPGNVNPRKYLPSSREDIGYGLLIRDPLL